MVEQDPESRPLQEPRVAGLVRDLSADDRELLITATLDNMNWCGPRFTRDQVLAGPAISHYFDAWRADRDLGLVAVDESQRPLGMIWTVLFDETDAGYGFVATDVPELSIWVEADHRGAGIGTWLLDELLQRAPASALRGLSLSVEEGNPARRLYERCGFGAAGEEHDPGTLALWL